VSSTGNSGDSIHIEQLELSVRVGVPDDEREQPQRLTLSITLSPVNDFRALSDEIEQTVNYAAVCQAVKDYTATRGDKLIETLAEGIAQHLLASFPVTRVELELRKFILPDVKHVAVRLTRDARR
jgi:dihydroneopterin aldolase